ncbi:MAG: 2-oxoacid:acceptor oxidoreductase family protein [Aquificaceae bacterium]|nr:2-oxoacid:acceptor oxidoreductase family protein [Aquificaceae bacterium]MCS7196241.1 2-oxoacid:acceptor oxidoreductase family protein [Aquificaceae bacterium]MDW8033119.1 2-oxoacid:acceptor oxidoreductase family protein [Aquificaceae bacterium]MDW8295120.1 2-oxoacid:acceptor oxidoreductase family protein [Aquificaceae bacterium]
MKRYNIRIAGVGGQGVVTSAHILGNAMSAAGKYATLVPFFGSEKRMAPVEAYVRVSDQPIYEVGEVVYPNVIMIYHPQVITHGKSYTMPFYSGLKERGLAIINTDADIIPEEDWNILNDLNTRVVMFPATKVALDIAGTELATNMAMIGLFFGITRIVAFEHIEQAVRERFLGNTFVASGGTTALDSAIEKKFKKKMELLEKNMQVIREAFKIAEERGWVEEEALTG